MFAKSGVQWGTLGEWAAAATGAAVVVYALLIRAFDRREALGKADRDEAAKVGVWYQGPETPPENRKQWLTVVENKTAAPVVEWEAVVWWVRMGTPGTGPHWETHHMNATRFGPLPPGARRVEGLGGDGWRDGEGNAVFPRNPARELRVSMIWRDAAGRWWLRYGGELHGPSERQYAGPWSARPDEPMTVDIDEVARRALPVVNGHRRLSWLPRGVAAKSNGRVRL